MNRNFINRSASVIFLILLRPNLPDKKSNSPIELNTSVNKELNCDESSFLQIIRRAIYMDLITKVDLQDKNQTIVSKLKTAIHNSILIQIIICLFTTVLFLLLVKSKLSAEGCQQDHNPKYDSTKTEDILFHENNNNPLKAEEEDEKDIIRMKDFKFEDFLNRIQSTSK